MLIIRYLIEEWRKLPYETKYDLDMAIQQLTPIQRLIIVLYRWGYSPLEIHNIILIQFKRDINVEEYLNVAINAIAEITQYSDYNVIKTSKGSVRKKDLQKCQEIVKVW